MKTPQRITVKDVLAKKKKGEKISMLTAYDYPMASLIDQAGIDIVLVGDSLANVVLGLDSTTQVGMPEMLHHAKAVNRAVKHALLVGDMPFGSYQQGSAAAVANARSFIQQAGCNAVKVEWFKNCPQVTQAIVGAGIPVMGHIGLTPQTADQLGGFKVQGKDAEAARKLIEQAQELEKRGCFSLVLECIPDKIAKLITEKLKIPTLGIGAGVHCDGQVLVINDLLGLFDRYRPKFVKTYLSLGPSILQVLKKYRTEVRSGKFPGRKHSFTISPEELTKLKQVLS